MTDRSKIGMGAVQEGRIVKNKKPVLGVIVFAAVLFLLWEVLCAPLRHYFIVRQNIEALKEKVNITKELNVERQILSQEGQLIIGLAQKEFESENESKPIAVWLGYYLTQCGVSHFGYSEESKVPLGGQGRPIFSVIASLYFSQALCVLDCFNLHSSDKKLTIMKLHRENDNPLLTLKLEMEIMR